MPAPAGGRRTPSRPARGPPTRSGLAGCCRRAGAPARSQRQRVPGRDQQAGLIVPDGLRDAGHPCRHARCAQGQRLQQHGRQAVGIAVGRDDAGRSEDGRPRHEGADLALWQRPDEPHEVLDACSSGPLLQRLGEGAVPGDDTRDGVGPGGENGNRVDEDVEALLLDEPADSDDLTPAGPTDELEGVEVEAVVDPAHRPGGLGERRAQVSEVVVAHGDDVVRVRELARQVLGVDLLVEDVLGVGREGVRAARDPRRDPGNTGRHRPEVGVQVVDPTLLDQD